MILILEDNTEKIAGYILNYPKDNIFIARSVLDAMRMVRLWNPSNLTVLVDYDLGHPGFGTGLNFLEDLVKESWHLRCELIVRPITCSPDCKQSLYEFCVENALGWRGR